VYEWTHRKPTTIPIEELRGASASSLGWSWPQGSPPPPRDPPPPISRSVPPPPPEGTPPPPPAAPSAAASSSGQAASSSSLVQGSPPPMGPTPQPESGRPTGFERRAGHWINSILHEAALARKAQMAIRDHPIQTQSWRLSPPPGAIWHLHPPEVYRRWLQVGPHSEGEADPIAYLEGVRREIHEAASHYEMHMAHMEG
jgi:hypothetical protein